MSEAKEKRNQRIVKKYNRKRGKVPAVVSIGGVATAVDKETRGAQSESDSTGTHRQKPNRFTKPEKLGQQFRQQKLQQKAAKQQLIQERIGARKASEKNKKKAYWDLHKRNNRGQPVMRRQIEQILDKIQRSK